eukprot:93778-Hanusia_phi.AAC.1
MDETQDQLCSAPHISCAGLPRQACPLRRLSIAHAASCSPQMLGGCEPSEGSGSMMRSGNAASR